MAPVGDRLEHAALDVLEREQVGRAPQVQRQRALREAAEPALERADVRVVDVAVADAGDGVADDGAPQLVGHLGDGRDLGAAGGEQGDDLVLADLLAEQHAVEHLADRAVPAEPAGRGHERARARTGAPEYQAVLRRPICTTSAPVPASTAALICSGNTPPGSSRPRPSASLRSSTGKRSARVEPALRVERELGVDR